MLCIEKGREKMGLLGDLKKKILLADGAIGTMLYAHGLQSCLEELNVTNGELITSIHKGYIEAGSQVIQTHTYGANDGKLRLHGLEQKVKAINEAAVKNAKNAAEKDTYILGTIGGMKHIGSIATTATEREYMLLQQADILLSEGIDGLLLETFYDEEELFQAVTILREKSKVPIIAQIALQDVGVTQSGQHIEVVFEQLEAIGADVVGLNCHLGPLHMVESFEQVPFPKHAFLSAYPNAGIPKYVDGEYVYEGSPEYFREMTRKFVNQGVRLLGGCCGTTPEHIRAMKEALIGLHPVTEKVVKERREKISILPTYPKKHESLAEKVKKETTVIVELDPPRTLDTKRFFEGAKALHHAGASMITLAENSLASPRISNVAMASLLSARGIPVLPHVTCRDRNLIGLQSHLLGLSALGLHEVLALTGDPARVGDFPGASSVYDVSSLELIRLIKQMNEGKSFVGKTIGQRANFSVGAAFNPNVKHIEAAVKRMEKKIQAGADYFLTQPVYDEETLRRTYEATKNMEEPIFIGIMPMTSKKNADFLHYEVPGISIPQQMRDAIEGAEEAGRGVEEGIQIAKSLIDAAIELFHGVYVITPFMKYEITEQLVAYIMKHQKRL